MSDEQLLTVDDVATRLRLHPETVRRWIREGKLRAVSLGSDRAGLRIHPSQLRWLQQETLTSGLEPADALIREAEWVHQQVAAARSHALLQQAIGPQVTWHGPSTEQLQQLAADNQAALARLPAESALWGDLAQRGWYLTDRVLVVQRDQLLEWHNASDWTAIEEFMEQFAEARVDEIRIELVRRYPTRAQILADAFAVHREGRYTVSIPAMLSQADGICRDILTVDLYGRNHGHPKTREKVLAAIAGDPRSHEFLRPVLEPLIQGSSLSAATGSHVPLGMPQPTGLNRHGVLHGLDVTYATRSNALRCVLLLAYISDIDAHGLRP